MDTKAIRDLKLSLIEEFKEIAKSGSRQDFELYVKENAEKLMLYELTQVLTSVQLKDVTFLNNNSIDQFGILGFNANNSSMPNFADPVAAQDPVTKNFYDNNVSTDVTPLTLGVVKPTGTTAIDANGETIPNLADPVNPQDPVTKSYFDNNHNTQDLTPFTLGVVEATGTTGIDANGETIPNLADPLASQDPVTLSYFNANVPPPGGGGFEIINSFASNVGTGTQLIESLNNDGHPFNIRAKIVNTDELYLEIVNNSATNVLYLGYVVEKKIPGQPITYTDPSGQGANYIDVPSLGGTKLLTSDGTEDGTFIKIGTDADRNNFLHVRCSAGILLSNVYTSFDLNVQIAPSIGTANNNNVLFYGTYTPINYTP